MDKELLECSTCPRCIGMRLEPHAGRSVLVCRTDESTGERVSLAPASAVTTRVARIMTAGDESDAADPELLRMPMGESVARAAALMALEGVTRVGVVDGANALVGVVRAQDILYWLACDAGFVLGERS